MPCDSQWRLCLIDSVAESCVGLTTSMVTVTSLCQAKVVLRFVYSALQVSVATALGLAL